MLYCSEVDWSSYYFEWVLRKVDEIRSLMEIYYEGYEEQFRALLTSIEASHTDLGKSASKKDKELNRLECTINNHSKE